MSKKKPVKKKSGVKNGKAEPKPQKVDSFDDEKPFDFGGLSQRDLKKNLGCG